MKMKNKVFAVLAVICLSLAFVASDCSNTNNRDEEEPSGIKSSFSVYSENGGTSWSKKDGFPGGKTKKLGYFSSSRDTIFRISTDETINFIFTTDKGADWHFIPNSPIGEEYNDISRTDMGLGILVGNNGKIARTVNNCSTWSYNSIAPGTNFIAVDFTTGLTGICIPQNSSNSAYFTSDGGTNWNQCGTMPYSGTLFDVAFISSFPGTEAAVCGSQGKILMTTNTGEAWFEAYSPLNDIDLTSIGFIDPVGICVGAEGKILRTSNRGVTWGVINWGGNNYLRNVYLEGSYYWAVGDDAILRSTDQGQTWVNVRTTANQVYTDVLAIKNECLVIGYDR